MPHLHAEPKLLPQRHYDLLGDVLAQAIVADGPASTTRRTAQQLARERGQALGERVRTQRRLGRLGPERALTVTSELLAACGYAPARTPTQGQLVLRNCPFRQLARSAPSWSAASTRSSWLACWLDCAPAAWTPSSSSTQRPTRRAAACCCRGRPPNPSSGDTVQRVRRQRDGSLRPQQRSRPLTSDSTTPGRCAGICYRIEGTPRPLPAAVDLSAYRVAQEALTNTLKHAGPARAELLVRYGRDALEITAVDNGSGTEPAANGPSRPGGQGLVGMRERVSLFGGELRAGTRPEGGFGVWARFPLQAGSS